MRKPFVAGNWKMNLNKQDAETLAEAIAIGTDALAGKSIEVAVFPPFVYLQNTINAVRNAGIAVGAQDVFYEQKGAFTGETSPAMLKDIGCVYALCGHSERRHIIGETDEIINKKVTAAISSGLLAVLCVGEMLEERESSKTEQVISSQVKAGLAGLTAEKASAVTIAYEPVWAIGTGVTATPQQAQQAHAMIRKLISEIFDEQLAQNTRILYGGSVKPSNAVEIMTQTDIDGALVGGASLKSEDFIAIIKAAL